MNAASNVFGKVDRLEGQQRSGWSAVATFVHLVAGLGAMAWVLRPEGPGFADPFLLVFLAVLALALPFERHAGRLRFLAVAWEANHDPLTGLHNRRFFMDQLSKRLSRPIRRHRMLGVMLLDLDHFKVINDTLGHAAGDQLLKGVAQRLKTTVGNSLIVARLGGDEFGVLADVTSKDDLEKLGEKTVDALSFRTTLNSQPVWTNGSVGAALAEAPKPSLEELLSRADIALYQAKNAGRNQVMVFEPHRPMPTINQLSLDYELRLAVEREQLLLYYQPIVSLTDGRISGFEALVRWRHPNLGFLEPNEFIPQAEENGLIHEIGLWVVREACWQLSEWQRLFGEDLGISINLSGLQISRPDIVSEISGVLRETGVNPRSVLLEITESALIQDEETTMANAAELREIGVSLSIDDFGVGYSSLNYLRRYPAEYVKIDKSFTAEIEDSRSFGVIKAAIDVGHVLGMSIIGEGVETPKQMELLMKAGADFAQGYFFYKPLPTREAAALLVESFALADGNAGAGRWVQAS
jgi:diguanylate cyclase (GGDEF)-like protein